MSLILVVEPEERYIQRIRDSLGSEGWRTRVVPDRAAALQAAASEAPNLVLVSADVEGASALIDAFARRSGGPGVVAIVDEAAAGGASAEGMGADELVTKPFTEQDLRLTVRRGLVASSKPAPKPAAPAAEGAAAGGSGAIFTSEDIFGELVAEVEGELASAASEEEPEPALSAPPQSTPPQSTPPQSTPPPSSTPLGEASVLDGPEGLPTIRIPAAATEQSAANPPAAPVTDPPAAEPPSREASPPSPVSPRPARDRDREEIERRLEQTLSGVLDSEPKAPAPAKPAAAKAVSESDVDSLLSETLTGLDLGAKPQRPATPAEPEDPLAGLDLSALDEIARPAKRAGVSPVDEERPSPAEVQPPPDFEPSVAQPGRAAGTAEPRAQQPTEPSPVEPIAASPPPELAPAAEPPPATVEELASAAGADPIGAAEPEANAEPAPRPEVEPERFGQYTLQERIAVGGMAEVWKARMRGVEGFQKTVAIKKILPHLSDNADFVTMFIDEAKLAAQLNHPNIIHIYDLGKIAESYYIAMEYVAGRNLRTLLDASKKKQRPIPPGLAILTAARLASALDYAHRKRDFDNRELGLVHRDVSPQNVLISFEGAIKLCDFGIAKAVAKASHTQMGALKGKLQYMSPEQAWGRTVDPRSDIFSLGSILFEMLTGQRLFTGDSEISVLEAVRECQVEEPITVVPDLPATANEIVMKALAKEPEHRYQAAGEMQSALEAALHSFKPTPGPAELTAYLEELSGARPAAVTAGEPSTGSHSAIGIATGTGSADAGGTGSRTGTGSQPSADTGTGGSAAAAADAGGTGAGTGAGAGATTVPETRAAAALDSTGFDDVSAVAEPLAPGLESPDPIAPVDLGGELAEEESSRGRWLLIGAILLAACLLVAAFFVFRPKGDGAGGAAPQGPAPVPSDSVEPPPPLLEDTLPGENDDAVDGEAETAGREAPTAAAAGTPAPPTEVVSAPDPATGNEEIESMVARGLAEREAQLRAEREAELRRLEAELAATRQPAEAEDEPPATARGEPEPAAAEPASARPAGPAGSESSGAIPEPARPPDEREPPTRRETPPASTTPSPASLAAPPAASETAPAPNAATPPPSPPGRSATAPDAAEPDIPETPSVREGDLVRAGPGVAPPKLVSFEKPQYPPVARRMRIEGDVIVAVLVNERGRVIDTRFVQTVRQNVGINEAALQTARNAKYEPATKDGVRVKMWTNLKLPFRL